MIHPVLSLLSARAAGTRADGNRLALVVEGGGMRGVVSAGMTAALEDLGFAGCFDLVVGTSAGALNGAALLAGVAGGCTEEYHGGFATREFINPARLLLGRPVVDVEYALDFSSAALDADRHARALANGTELHCVATDVATAGPADLTGLSTPDDLRSALLATSRLPWIGGQPVPFRGRTWLDGGLTEPVPLPTALAAGATHALVLLTRAFGTRLPAPGGLGDRLVTRKLRALNPELATAYRRRTPEYEAMLDMLASAGTAGPPYVLAIAPDPAAPVPSRTDRDRDRLRAAAEHARRRAAEVLEAA
jgi:predicted patatin/cPLA2 family phospholipase